MNIRAAVHTQSDQHEASQHQKAETCPGPGNSAENGLRDFAGGRETGTNWPKLLRPNLGI